MWRRKVFDNSTKTQTINDNIVESSGMYGGSGASRQKKQIRRTTYWKQLKIQPNTREDREMMMREHIPPIAQKMLGPSPQTNKCCGQLCI
jgi:hypothetical protein